MHLGETYTPRAHIVILPGVLMANPPDTYSKNLLARTRNFTKTRNPKDGVGEIVLPETSTSAIYHGPARTPYTIHVADSRGYLAADEY